MWQALACWCNAAVHGHGHSPADNALRQPPNSHPLLTALTSSQTARACSIADGENVRTVMCLQEDSDMAYFDLDVAPILDRAAQRGGVRHVRHRIR